MVEDIPVSIVYAEDGSRSLKFRPDIYQFAYSLCLKQEELEELSKPEPEGNEEPKPRLHCIPLQSQVNEVIITAFICAASVLFVSIFIMKESLLKQVKCKEYDEQSEDAAPRCFKYIDWPL